ncbi:Regulator of K+ conductance N-terminal [Arabidopsis thaliana x Arabidopsis arenosa]|uniref:KEA2 n=2 Tax=Arabidopsis TaxID=3701 RepID=A0A178UX76_ARATH|nr:Regulator of K+ conductance N-terminal [Arabidopsis thaliana x Arabidopsis arenosa]OAO98007.1 KEA2 [Arabidopsis thaliana]
MDFASSVQRRSMFHGGADFASYCLPNRMISAKLCPKGLGGTRFWDPMIDSKVRSAIRSKRNVSYRASLTLNADFNGRFYGHLLPAKPQNVPLGFRLLCQSSDSVGDLVENDRNLEFAEGSDDREVTFSKEEKDTREQDSAPSLEELRDLLNKATKELEVASLNSTMFEEKAQRISEVAIALKDEAASAWNDVNQTLNVVQEAVDEESVAKEAVQKATMALSLAEARLQVALESLEAEGYNTSEESEVRDGVKDKEEALLSAKADIKECQENLASCEEQLRRLQVKKDELQKEVDRLNEAAERAQISALKAEEDVANIMVLAEQAVAFELEATQRVNDAEIALQRAEKTLFGSQTQETTQGKVLDGKNTIVGEDEVLSEIVDVSHQAERDLVVVGVSSDVGTQSYESDNENGKPTADFAKEAEGEAEKSKNVVLTKKQEVQKDLPRESSSHNGTKTSLKKSSRFFPASFFSSNGDGTATVFESLVESVKQQWPKLILGFTLLGAGVAIYSNGVGRNNQLPQQPNIVSTSAEDVSSSTKPLIRQMQKLPKRIKKLLEMFPQQEVNEEEASLLDVLWLLLASVIFVPLFQKIPGGSPVLGYLAAGILIGPYGLSIIRNVHGTKAIAEFGVVFLLFNIGLELSVERLSSMKKYVFGLGSAQVLVTAAVIGLITHYVAGQAGPAAIVIGNGLALSSTAVVLQVLQERGESTSRHGRATFSVLLFQDLAVVVLLILIPLISPNSSKGGIGFQAIAEALGLAAIKAAVAITGIIAGGRLLLRPIYKQIAENRNAEIFSANTLLVILGTSLLTARAGLSMALGAFLAGLLLAETEFSLQVESDIAPYRGLLLGLFFMTVGMSIDPKLLLANFPLIMGTLGLLLVGKTILVVIIGKLFGISIISAVRVGLLLAPGGEFAFVAFGEAVNQGIMTPQLSSLLFLVVGISMALTPWLAAGGQLIASRFELQDVRSLLPVESETDDLQGHIIICGFGRIGQIIAQLLSERLIPFVALDVSSDRVAIGRSLDLPVYFGDAGSREVLHKIGADRACAAAIALDTPGANYRCVWALSKYFPNVKTFVRAHDVDHGLNLEKAGATAVVPETLEPSLQLAAAVLAQAKLPTSEIATTINEFRSRHLSELAELCEASGSSLGYGFSRSTSKPKPPSPSETSDDNQIIEGTLAI